uniref:helix-turn-helix domain-containing protein n=1 Tax=Streptomyces roseoverticillatus TaxID=66429 RepID=UPI001F2B03C0|nr:helix-turn-helix domain-containing protein [Streptomyces roseoverticillatus]
MRYPQSGGLAAERRTFRERIRLEAAELFAAGEPNAVIARALRMSVRPVQRWRSVQWRTSERGRCKVKVSTGVRSPWGPSNV